MFSIAKRILSLLLILEFLILFVIIFSNFVYADSLIDKTCSLQNVNASSNTYPQSDNCYTIPSKVLGNNHVIDINALVELGAQITFNPLDESERIVIINGQYLTFSTETQTFYSSTPYEIKYPDSLTGVPTSYTFNVWGNASITPFINNGIFYVDLKNAMNQCGALYVRLNPGTSTYIVNDFRINGIGDPYNDTNQYLIAGPWITGWSSKDNMNLSAHFKVKEFRSSMSAINYPNYYNQMKISVQLLQSAENVRHNYGSNTYGLKINSGFRSWDENKYVRGTNNSHHMRGRAFDAANYNNLYANVKNGDDFSIYAHNLFSRPMNSLIVNKSGGIEIEKMPQNNGTWLHLQVSPGYDFSY